MVILHVCSAVLTHGYAGQLPGGTSIGPHINLCMLCSACFLFLFLNNDFVVITNTICISMFNFIDINSCIPMSGCVTIGPSVLLCPGAYDIAKTALL